MRKEKSVLKKVRNQELALNYLPILSKNYKILFMERQDHLDIPLIDIYLNDTCNLHCSFCVTKKGTSNLPINASRYLKQLRPSVMSITGGGEPSIYRYEEKKIEDFIHTIDEKIPLGIMTNGVELINESVFPRIEWLRVSINAATQNSYLELHNRDFFDRVLKNIITYLNSPIKKVAMGYVFTPASFKEMCLLSKVVIDRIFPHVLDKKDQEKLTLQFRPVVDNDYHRFELTQKDQQALREEIDKLSSAEKEFLILQSNIMEALDNGCYDLSSSFDRCFVSLLQMNIDAQGNAYPCPQKAHLFEDSYGNIFEKDFFKTLPSRLKNCFEKKNCHTCPCCAQARINALFEKKDLESNHCSKIKKVFF